MHFSAEAEADLQQVYGVNLRGEYQQRQWRRLLNLIDQLPPASRLSRAMFDDDDIVREMWSKTPKGQRKQQWKPSVAEWTPEMRALAMIHDRLGDIAQATMSTIQTKSGKPPKYKGDPFPQPETRMEAIEREESRKTGLWLISQFTPHAGLWDTPPG